MSEQKHWKWLSEKFPLWEEKGVLKKGQAEKILAEKPVFRESRDLLTRILIGISALLFGLGVISFFAFNWQAMPKWLKLSIIFLSFTGAHTLGYVLGKNHEKKVLSELCHLLGTFLFGAAIMLIAQIYHIDEHSPNGVFLWSLGALMMAYVLSSTPQMLIFACLLLLFQGMELSYRISQLWIIPFSIVVLIPFAIQKKHWFTTAISALAIALVFSFQLINFKEEGVIVLLFLGVIYIGAGLGIIGKGFAKSAIPVIIIGHIFYFSLLIPLTYTGAVKEIIFSATSQNDTFIVTLFPFIMVVLAGVVWGYVIFPFQSLSEKLQDIKTRESFFILPVFLWAVFLFVMSYLLDIKSSDKAWAITGMVGFNLFAVIHGIALIFSGTRSGRVFISFLGCLLVVIVILLRFAAYSDNLLIRSASFVAAGAFILVIAVKTSKTKSAGMEHEHY